MKPVAWTNKDELAKYRPIIAEKEYSIHFPIPLYTHPVKELTDEEIKDFLATFPIIFTVDDLCTFARAILRKAQEK